MLETMLETMLESPPSLEKNKQISSGTQFRRRIEFENLGEFKLNFRWLSSINQRTNYVRLIFKRQEVKNLVIQSL